MNLSLSLIYYIYRGSEPVVCAVACRVTIRLEPSGRVLTAGLSQRLVEELLRLLLAHGRHEVVGLVPQPEVGAPPAWARAKSSAALGAADPRLTRAPGAAAGRPVGRSLACERRASQSRQARPEEATRVELGRCQGGASAMRLHFSSVASSTSQPPCRDISSISPD